MRRGASGIKLLGASGMVTAFMACSRCQCKDPVALALYGLMLMSRSLKSGVGGSSSPAYGGGSGIGLELVEAAERPWPPQGLAALR